MGEDVAGPRDLSPRNLRMQIRQILRKSLHGLPDDLQATNQRTLLLRIALEVGLGNSNHVRLDPANALKDFLEENSRGATHRRGTCSFRMRSRSFG